MEVIFLLIGVSLVLAGSFLYLFFKAVKSGQFEDDYTPSVRILFDNHKKPNKNQPIKPKSNE
ncbi:cbb3-type cytochrome oxidase assembly protein CcoS [Algoriphagus kandeliae]|uniref:Cbb3-type cytochrome oxidase assembly protein CcoS n=1 Tax=Algoriphagus kandeliae TaxID=2562278 RepID=A0A4Y9QXD6_9BACT|nr:cbb3-type cytochrome oxidase assembly protein CcoS [Algoriphagus kandeliae]TFV97091.1 cbb3-type cytochrome oxidase assembly protein CcoS [Algoriphagus kandeliae]